MNAAFGTGPAPVRKAALPSGQGPQRLAIEDAILIDVVAPGLPTALVFSAVNSSSFSYYKLFNSFEVNRIFVRDPSDDWFQNGVTAELNSIDRLADYLGEALARLRPSRTLAFGSSMGGYASLVFGNLLGLDAVVAICPQTLLDPRLPHTPATASGGAYDDLAVALASLPAKPAHHVFFGSADMVDIYNVHRLAHEGMTLLPVAGQDHMVMHHLMRNGEFERCVAAWLAGEPYACRTPLDARSRDPLLRAMVGRLIDGFYRGADWSPERYARAVLALEPEWGAANFMQAQVWAAEGRLDEALKQASRALKRCPDSIAFADFRANLLLRLKLYGEALTAYERCLAIRPKHYAALCALATLHARAGRPEIGLRYADAAVAIRPRHVRAVKLRETIAAGLTSAQNIDEAVAAVD